ncbi:MAG TPA: hypothetical protein VI146_01510 [Nitrososphaeraceae archaeon]
MHQKIGILVVLTGVLLSAAVLVTPSFKIANAQGNGTQGNQTMAQGLPIDMWIKVLKDKNPSLKDIEQDSKVNDAIGKIKGMQDPKQAVETFNALQALQQLMNLKSAQEAK